MKLVEYQMSSKALFLDRDGVINIDNGYVHRVEDFHFIDGIFELSRMAISRRYLICVITNQAGIGRGFYSESDFNALTDWMCEQFRMEGVKISNVYFSPYHPVYGIGIYRKDDISRKPNPGMLLQAQKELDIDLSKSIFIGDNLTDMDAGIAAGIGKNILLLADDKQLNCKTDGYFSVSSLKNSEIYL